MAKFQDVIECLKKGGSARRISWTDNREIIHQIPQCISKDIVPKMTSLPASIKPKISTVGSGEISYHDQVIVITFVDDEKTPASATYFIPTWEDIFAEDWSCLTPADEPTTEEKALVPEASASGEDQQPVIDTSIPVTMRIKTYEDAFNEVNIRAMQGDKVAEKLIKDLQFNSPYTDDLLAYIKLRIITYAINEGWEPQFVVDEYRYWPWFWLYTQQEIDAMNEAERSKLLVVGGRANLGAQCGLAFASSSDAFSYSHTYLGARLAFKSRELAEYAGRQFIELWAAFSFKPVVNGHGKGK